LICLKTSRGKYFGDEGKIVKKKVGSGVVIGKRAKVRVD